MLFGEGASSENVDSHLVDNEATLDTPVLGQWG